MADLSALIPELSEWNFGLGISPSEWICGVGRADQALGLTALVWPEITTFEGYILRQPFNESHLRGWEADGRATREQIETVMNIQFLENLFPYDETEPGLKSAQIEELAAIMTNMLRAKLAHDFPTLRFEVFIIDDEDDFGVSFHQA